MDLIDQQFTVGFRYPVYFTTGVFHDSNPLLHRTLTSSTGRRPSDLVAIIDGGVVNAHPTIIQQAETYLGRHGDDLRLTAPILVVPGGEVVKNDPKHLD